MYKNNKLNSVFSVVLIVFLLFIIGCILNRKYSVLSQKREKHAVISGQSITGMIAAAILAKSGYQVDTYEIRDKYSRNIQWAARQSLVDELASIDQGLARSFLENVARPLYRGSIHINPNGVRRVKKHDGLREGNPLEVPKDGKEMMKHFSVVNMEAKIFEIFLKRYLQSLPNVHCHFESMKLQLYGGSFHVAGQGVPDLIVIAEGADSATRKALGIGWEPITQSRLQIAGSIEMDSGGVMIKHWRNEAGSLRLTGVMGREGSDKTWIIADIDPSKTSSQKGFVAQFPSSSIAA